MSLVVKILLFLLTTAIIGAVAFFMFAFMIIAMNGYSGSDAEYGLVLFTVWAVVVSVGAGALAVLAAHLLEKRRQIHYALSSLIAFVVFIVLGLGANAAGVVAGIGLSEIVRTMF
ncbi:MAG: hypothetical protein R2681_11555 [Pyrinomonadaceae bacterium]